MTDRELDILVARHVFGAELWRIGPDLDEDSIFVMATAAEKYPSLGRAFGGSRSGTPRENGWTRVDVAPPTIVEVTAYSSTGDGMLCVIEKMRELGFGFDVGAEATGAFAGSFGGTIGTVHKGAHDVANKMPELIARAAVMALGVELR